MQVGTEQSYAIYKPVSGERPLWDFPDGTLAARERAAYLLSEAGGFGLVPETVIRDAPVGPGSVQRWVGQPDEPLDDVVDIVVRSALEPGWVVGFEAEDLVGRTVVVAHRDTAQVRSMAVLDAVLNNADRKGGHLALDAVGHLWGFDHGLVCHAEPKLRTVLWGFAGEPLEPHDIDRLGRLRACLEGPLADELEPLLTLEERQALLRRVDGLLGTGRHPDSPRHRYGIPWPPI